MAGHLVRMRDQECQAGLTSVTVQFNSELSAVPSLLGSAE
jgi:hypothetical protein